MPTKSLIACVLHVSPVKAACSPDRFGGAPGDWAKYAIVLKRVISIEQAEVIKALLAEIAPARCQLLYLDFRSNPLYWDGEITFNGNYTFGAITSG